MQVVDIAQMQVAIDHVCVRMNQPMGVLGPSGCGKSEGPVQLCAERGWIYHPVLLGQYDTVDLKGTPWVSILETEAHDHEAIMAETDKATNDKLFTVWRPASTLPFKGNPKFDENGPIILLHLDELTSALVGVMGICYQLIHERCVGEHKLMDNVRILVSGNRATDKGIVNRMPAPLDNRITWFESQPSVEGWSKWALKNGVAPIGVAFLGWQKDKLMTFDPAKPEKAFATPRSWVRALKYYADTTMPKWLREAAMSGAIGAGVSAIFWSFVEHYQQVSKLMPDIKKNPDTAEIPTEESMRYAIALSISGDIDTTNDASYDIYLKRMNPEFRVMTWTLATTRDGKLYKCKSFAAYAKDNKAIYES